MAMRRLFFPLSIAVAGLAGCAGGNGAFPSLAPRPIERIGEETPPRPAPTATPDAALDARLTRLQADLAGAARAFEPAAAHARTLVAAARSAGIGSDAWLDAQTALAELDGIRAESTAAMGALDELAIDRATALAPAYPALDSLHDKGEAQVADETATIAALQQQLPGT
jgi:hypothetical protein